VEVAATWPQGPLVPRETLRRFRVNENMTIEEHRSRVKENGLRQEHRLPDRAIPEGPVQTPSERERRGASKSKK